MGGLARSALSEVGVVNIDWDGPWSLRVGVKSPFWQIVERSWTEAEKHRLELEFSFWWARLYG